MQKRRPDQTVEEVAAARRGWIAAAVIAAIVVLLDQLTKSWAIDNFFDRTEQIAGPLSFTLVLNDGVAFGLGSGAAPVLIAVVVLTAVVLLLGRNIAINKPTIVGAGFVIGGALGNLYDRLFREFGGAVIDFIDIGSWPVFNLADMGVVGGAILLAIWGTRRQAEV